MLSEVKRTHAKVISKFGKIEVLINNIGSGKGTSNVIPEISEWKKIWKKILPQLIMLYLFY